MTALSDLTPPARSEFWALLALRHARGIGHRRAKCLWDAFGSGLAAVQACLANPTSWSGRGLAPLAAARAFAAEQWREGAKKEWAGAGADGVSFLCIGDSAYPERLRELPDAPLVLYYKGDISLLRGPAVGVVGARDCTREGIAVSSFFARALSRAGVTVISGLARGIDRAAHLAGLEGPGRSAGILGAGVDVIYPTCNADLHALMAEKGLLLSEYAPGTPAGPGHFPVRNRLISGLSRGVLVIEASDRSGSLITARLALEQNRDVFAVPGHTMAAVSGGCRELIRRGAKAVFNADDILWELAPLLTLDARAALNLRQEEAARKKNAQVRKRHKEPRETLVTDGPMNGLPAPSTGGPSRTGSATPEGGAADPAPEHPGPAPAVPDESPDVRPPAPSRSSSSPARLSGEEKRVLRALSPQPRHIDDIARKTGLDAAKLSSLLVLMELRGLLRYMPGMLYALPDAGEDRHDRA